MNWEAAGALGEIIGAVAVIATLAFLAVQVRHGHRVQREANVLARSAAIDRIHDQLRDFSCLVAADPELIRIWLAGCAGEELDPIDRERFYRLARTRRRALGRCGADRSARGPSLTSRTPGSGEVTSNDSEVSES